MRQSKKIVYPEQPSVKTSKSRGAKLKPVEFALLMSEMANGSAITSPKRATAKKRVSSKAKKAPALSISIPSKKDKKDIADMAHQMSVVCTPWYTMFLSRRLSFLIGLWIGIVGMGLLSLVAWSVVKDRPFFNTAVSVVTSSPSTVTQ